MSDKKRFGCLKPSLIGIVVILVILMIALSSIVTKVANDQLPKQLGTEATLEGSQVNLLAGRVALKELTIQQPEGFADLSEDPLLTLEELVVNVPLRKAIDRSPMIVRSVHLKNVDLSLITNSNMIVNVTQLGPASLEEPEDSVEGEAEEVVKEEPSEPATVPPVWVKHVLLEQITLAYYRQDLDWGIDIEDIRIEVDDLQVMESQVDGPAIIKGHMSFHSEKATAEVQVYAKLGVLTPDRPEIAPTVQIVLGVIGFDLDLLEPFLVPSPAVAKTAFGGGGFDFKLFMQVGPGEKPEEQAVRGKFELKTNRGQRTTGKLGGSVAEPDLPFTGLFADVLGNQFGRAIGTVGNVAEGTFEVGKTVGKTGLEAVKGAGETVGGLATGLFKTAKGVVTRDGEEAMGGLKQSTVGTVKNAAGAVGDTAGTAGEGLKDSAGKVTGGDSVQKWWSEVETRQSTFGDEAMAWFEAHPFEKLLAGEVKMRAPEKIDPASSKEEGESKAEEREERKTPQGLKGS